MCISKDSSILIIPLCNGSSWIVFFIGDQHILREHFEHLVNVFSIKTMEDTEQFVNNISIMVTAEEKKAIDFHLVDVFNKFSSIGIYNEFNAAILTKREMISLLEPGNAIFFPRPISSVKNWLTAGDLLARMSSWFEWKIFEQFVGLPAITHCGVIVGVTADNAVIIHDPGYIDLNKINGLEYTTLNAQLGFEDGSADTDEFRLMTFYIKKCTRKEVYPTRCRWVAVQTAHLALNDPRIYNWILRNCENFAVYCCTDRRNYGGQQISTLATNMARYIVLPAVCSMIVSSSLYFQICKSVSVFRKPVVIGSTGITIHALLCTFFAYDQKHNNYFGNMVKNWKLRYANDAWLKSRRQEVDAAKDSTTETFTDAYNDAILLVMTVLKLKPVSLWPKKHVTMCWQVLSTWHIKLAIQMFSTLPISKIHEKVGIENRCRLIREYKALVTTLDEGAILTFSIVELLVKLLRHSIWNKTDLGLISYEQSIRPIWFDNLVFMRETYDLVNTFIKTTIYGFKGQETVGFPTTVLFPWLLYVKSIISDRFQQLLAPERIPTENEVNNNLFQALVDCDVEKHLVQTGMFINSQKLRDDRKRTKERMDFTKGVRRKIVISDGDIIVFTSVSLENRIDKFNVIYID